MSAMNMGQKQQGGLLV